MAWLRFSPATWFPPFMPPPFLLAASFVALGWLAVLDMLSAASFSTETASLGPGMETVLGIFLLMKGIPFEIWQSVCITDSTPSFTWSAWSQLCGMGAIMTLVMMLPCATPAWRMLRTGGSAAMAFSFLGGYCVIWILFSVALATLDMALNLHLGPHLVSTAGMTGVVAAGAVIGAGAFQWTSFKHKAQGEIATRSIPAAHDDESTRASFAAGIRYAGSCIKSNGALMVTMMFLGMMNIVAMTLLFLAMVLERRVAKKHVSHAIGLALVLAGSRWIYLAASA